MVRGDGMASQVTRDGTHLCFCEYLVLGGFPRADVSGVDDEERVGSSILALHACDCGP